MEMKKDAKYAVTGTAAGLINGFFGGGGGIVLVPLLTGWCGEDGKTAFATSVGAILPMCAVSAAVHLVRDGFAAADVIPFLLGGLAGGIAGGMTFRHLPVNFLRKAFALLLILGGIRCIF